MKRPWIEIVANDIHIPKQNVEAVNCLFKTIELIQPNGITLNGDIMDSGTFSRHDIYSPPKCHWTDSQFIEESQHEYDGMNQFLDSVQRLAPKARKRYEFGNHEVWVEEFIKKSYKARHPIFNLPDRLALKKRGYEVYNYGDFMPLGELRVTHGFYQGEHHAKKHVDMMGRSILYGHLHDIQVHSKVTPEKISHMAWSNGCLCDMNPGYLRGKPQRWNHGFAIVYLFPNGHFQVDVKRITKNRVVVWGTVIEG